jgi:diguanylate cyclase (GGDEF)-like protein
MEEAQNLSLGDPQSGEREVILGSILSLLERLIPHIQLFICLDGEASELPCGPRIFFGAGDPPAPRWLAGRKPGKAVLIPSWLELPAQVREILDQRSAVPTGEPGPEAGRYRGGIAVPLYEPDSFDPGADFSGPEVGLLFLVPRQSLTQPDLLSLGMRLSRFVSRRWRHVQEVNQRIHTDSLTGIHNRAFFDSQFALELERAKRNRSPLTLVLADLDHFKRINDLHGHQVGDEVLTLVARELQKGLRRIDHVCRIGGEEFGLLLPDTSPDAAQEVLARLQAGLASVSLAPPEAPAPVKVTLSFGVVTFPEGGTDAATLYRKADAMLYLSKRLGRNRCSFWNPSGEPSTLLSPVDRD